MITQRVTIDELEVGMYVEAVLKQTGSLRVKTQGRVHSQRVIQQLKRQGILELTISDQGDLLESKATDEQNSTEQVSTETVNSDPYSNKAEAPDDPTERMTDFQDEIGQATSLYNQAKQLQKKASKTDGLMEQLTIQTEKLTNLFY